VIYCYCVLASTCILLIMIIFFFNLCYSLLVRLWIKHYQLHALGRGGRLVYLVAHNHMDVVIIPLAVLLQDPLMLYSLLPRDRYYLVQLGSRLQRLI
jgi:hypothetical protein